MVGMRKIKMKPIHKKILDKIAELCERYPSLRFGQILFNYTKIGTEVEPGLIVDPFHYQDDEFLDSIEDIERGSD